MNDNILTEISLLSENDCFDIAERYKSEFDYPLHRHREFELNYVQNASGASRIIGDSIETIGDFDLVLIGKENMEHVWKQGSCTSKNIREITIQFSPKLLSDAILSKNQFMSIKTMLDKAQSGISFPTEAILKVYNIFDSLVSEQDGFIQFTNFLILLYRLSQSEYKILGSDSYALEPTEAESRRIMTVKDYINKHINEPIHLEDLASIAGMGTTAFSRYFKLSTHKTVTDYIIDIKLGKAARMLIDSTQNISEICYASGFNNLANFNRLFKAHKGMTPKNFRAYYKKNKVIV